MNKEELVKIIENAELSSSGDKADAINKLLAEVTIPKDKYNELNEKLKTANTQLDTKTKEFDDYKMSKMTDEEKEKAKYEDMVSQLHRNKMDLNRLEVEKIFESNGLKEEDYKAILPIVVGDDRDSSIAGANAIVGILVSNAAKVEQTTKQELLKTTPSPVGGTGGTKTSSNLEELQKSYQEAVKNKDQISQARLLREIQMEQAKNQSIK